MVSSSAQLSLSHTEDDHITAQAITRVLSKNGSPMLGDVDGFIRVSNTYDLDPYLLPSIAGIESGFGRVLIPGTHNPFGWNGGRMYFDTWEEGIEAVGSALRFKYMDRGADTLEKIGYKYAGGSTTWAPKVRNQMTRFEREEEKIRRYSML